MPDPPFPAGPAATVALVGEDDVADLLPLLRAYCDFYRTAPADDELRALADALVADPVHEGVQLLARGPGGGALGFATVFWTWSTTRAARIGVMNDLYVTPGARGRGIAELLIAACVDRCAGRGASTLEWQTAPDNRRAQAVYDRVGGRRETWIDYSLPVPGAR